eukprot:CAMPEP_0183400168 /NCGR_PEP_ID=MMETSP0370-20130417/12417_1 /TAXON_ID=268820 /ORGANISM="Peridinium aciculiferum, Strain PAER-2" /LENGTH=67 /DNA_ID=CAMNT_0025581429 /DNA_START=30 /DNA_END=229 /DNA_ORIENTATION=-
MRRRIRATPINSRPAAFKKQSEIGQALQADGMGRGSVECLQKYLPHRGICRALTQCQSAWTLNDMQV